MKWVFCFSGPQLPGMQELATLKVLPLSETTEERGDPPGSPCFGPCQLHHRIKEGVITSFTQRDRKFPLGLLNSPASAFNWAVIDSGERFIHFSTHPHRDPRHPRCYHWDTCISQYLFLLLLRITLKNSSSTNFAHEETTAPKFQSIWPIRGSSQVCNPNSTIPPFPLGCLCWCQEPGLSPGQSVLSPKLPAWHGALLVISRHPFSFIKADTPLRGSAGSSRALPHLCSPPTFQGRQMSALFFLCTCSWCFWPLPSRRLHFLTPFSPTSLLFTKHAWGLPWINLPLNLKPYHLLQWVSCYFQLACFWIQHLRSPLPLSWQPLPPSSLASWLPWAPFTYALLSLCRWPIPILILRCWPSHTFLAAPVRPLSSGDCLPSSLLGSLDTFLRAEERG